MSSIPTIAQEIWRYISEEDATMKPFVDDLSNELREEVFYIIGRMAEGYTNRPFYMIFDPKAEAPSCDGTNITVKDQNGHGFSDCYHELMHGRITDFTLYKKIGLERGKIGSVVFNLFSDFRMESFISIEDISLGITRSIVIIQKLNSIIKSFYDKENGGKYYSPLATLLYTLLYSYAIRTLETVSSDYYMQRTSNIPLTMYKLKKIFRFAVENCFSVDTVKWIEDNFDFQLDGEIFSKADRSVEKMTSRDVYDFSVRFCDEFYKNEAVPSPQPQKGGDGKGKKGDGNKDGKSGKGGGQQGKKGDSQKGDGQAGDGGGKGKGSASSDEAGNNTGSNGYGSGKKGDKKGSSGKSSGDDAKDTVSSLKKAMKKAGIPEGLINPMDYNKLEKFAKAVKEHKKAKKVNEPNKKDKTSDSKIGGSGVSKTVSDSIGNISRQILLREYAKVSNQVNTKKREFIRKFKDAKKARGKNQYSKTGFKISRKQYTRRKIAQNPRIPMCVKRSNKKPKGFFILLIDISSSMLSYRNLVDDIRVDVQGLYEAIKKLQSPELDVECILYNGSCEKGQPSRVCRPSGSTYIASAMEMALKTANIRKHDQNFVMIFTDGELGGTKHTETVMKRFPRKTDFFYFANQVYSDNFPNLPKNRRYEGRDCIKRLSKVVENLMKEFVKYS